MLNTTITRDDAPLPLPHGWGWWHVECMVKVIQTEQETQPLDSFAALLDATPHTVKGEHTFTDPADGEVLTLKPGDVLNAWRDR